MRQFRRKCLAAFGTALALGLLGMARAHEGHDHGTGPHGVAVEKTKTYQFEVICSKSGLKVYPATAKGAPLDTSRLSGTATFYHPRTAKPWFDRPLRPAAASPGQAPTALGVGIDLSKVPAKGAKVAIEVTGLPDPAEPTASFTVPFALSNTGELTVAKATAADQAAIAAQQVCKVSGEELGSMGMPVKVTRGDRSIFLCCQNCLKDIKANPDKFFGAAAAPKAK